MPETPKKNGRPYKVIDKDEFEKLCMIQCTKLEMCDWFCCDDKTLESWCKRTYNKGFSEIFKQKRGKGKISLRRTGFQMAQEVPAVWIFHAKNFLGMSDKQEIKQEVTQKTDIDYSKYTPEELEQLEMLLKKGTNDTPG